MNRNVYIYMEAPLALDMLTNQINKQEKALSFDDLDQLTGPNWSS